MIAAIEIPLYFKFYQQTTTSEIAQIQGLYFIFIVFDIQRYY